MRDLLLHTHIRLTGQQEIAALLLPFARHQLQNLVEQSRTTSAPNLTRRLDIPGSIVGGNGAVVEVRVMGAQHYISIHADKGCKDNLGFLLTRTPDSKYDARYNDGFVERIEPVDGSPRPVPDPAVRTVGYKVPAQLRQSPTVRVQASKFSGLMRLAVGCYHGRGVDAPFSFSWGRTHGIVKLDVDVGNPSVPTPHYWVVEISASGLYAAPIKNTGLCCDSWSISRYVPTAAEIAAQPSLEANKTTLSLSWAFSVARKDVLQLVSAGDLAAAGIYSSGSPWYADCGWAFSASGASAQNVVVSQVGSPTRFLCSRFQVSFAIQAGALAAQVSVPEANLVAQFPEFSTVWKPVTHQSWINTKGLTLTQQQASVYTSQDAPVHVYYVGEDAVITRWQLASSNKLAMIAACTQGLRKQFSGTPPFCRLITTAHKGPVCQGLNNSPSASPIEAGNSLGSPGDGLDTSPPAPAADVGFLVHDGQVAYGGQIRDIGAHFFVNAGFASSVVSTVRERSSKSVVQRDTQQGGDISSVIEGPSMYQLHVSCHYFANHCPPQPGDPVLITFAPVVHRITTYTALVWNDLETVTESRSARTGLVLFLTEREAALLVVRSSESKAGTQNKESLSSNPLAFLAHIRERREKVGEAATPGWPAGCLTSPYEAWEGPTSEGIAHSPGLVDTTVTALNTFSFSATGTLGVGSITAGVVIPSESVAGGFMPLSNLSPFLFGNVASPPEPEVEVGSQAFAQHGNLYYDDLKLVPVNQAGNAAYLLDQEVITAGGFDPAFTEAVAFVGKA